MLTYRQSTGELIGPDGEVWGTGYSGYGVGVNNPIAEDLVDVGPIPKGSWRVGPPYDSPRTGPFTLGLTPLPGTADYGRTDFRIHGDDVEHPGMHIASHGCIILARGVRERIDTMNPYRLLEVVA